jgi:hypothetical protein
VLVPSVDGDPTAVRAHVYLLRIDTCAYKLNTRLLVHIDAHLLMIKSCHYVHVYTNGMHCAVHKRLFSVIFGPF